MDKVHQLLEEFDRHRITRRELLQGLSIIIAGAAVAGGGTTLAAEDNGMLPLVNWNHLNVMTSDVKKTAEFYRVLFGARAQSESPMGALMSFPGASGKNGGGCW